jgi:hypothetical protein
MRHASTFLLLAIAAAGCACAQSPQQIEMRQILDDLSAQSKRLIPILEQIDPNVWVTAKGAPDGYIRQWHSSQDQLKALIDDTANLSKDPERLPFALQTFFRVQSLQVMLQSLVDGIRRYQNPALADLLAGIAAEGSGDREKFQQYIMSLATERDQMFGIMDHEAQRCRSILSNQGVPVPPRPVTRK